MKCEAYFLVKNESQRWGTGSGKMIEMHNTYPCLLQNLFEFDFDVDVEEENYEMIELPEIFFGRYMHDFKAGLFFLFGSGSCLLNGSGSHQNTEL